MEFASCYDQSTGIFASTMFLNITAFFTILAAFAVVRLVTISGESSVNRLQTA